MRSILIALLFPLGSMAASQVTPVYDNASFRTGLTLPFVITAVKADSSAQIVGLKVNSANAESLEAANSCVVAVDPMIRSNILLKCKDAGRFNLKVDVVQGGSLTEINYGPLNIQALKPGYTEPIVDKPTIDPDVVAGRSILFTKAEVSGARRTCVTCHTTPDTYSLRTNASVTRLQTLNQKASMAAVPNLNATEAAQVRKYLATVKDGGIWP